MPTGDTMTTKLVRVYRDSTKVEFIVDILVEDHGTPGVADAEPTIDAMVLAAAKMQLRTYFKGDLNDFAYEIECLQ